MTEKDMNDVLEANLKELLPHKDQTFIDDLVIFLIVEGVINESDLRFMTIPIMKTKLSTVDASRVCEAWQAKYGPKSNQENSVALMPVPQMLSGSASASSSTDQTPCGRSSKLPVFHQIDSPYIPAGVRNAILKKRRPKPQDLEDFVTRIVDHTQDVVKDFVRGDLKTIAINIVKKWEPTFQDTIITDKDGIGHLALWTQLKVKYDNKNRKDNSKLFEETNQAPEAYGCNWKPSLPENQTEDAQEDIRKALRKSYDAGRRRWDWKTIKSNLEDSFYLQRKEINGEPEVAEPTDKRRSRKRKANEMLGQAGPAAVVTLRHYIDRWPFLMEVQGLNCHFKILTGVDFENCLTTFIETDGKPLVECLSSKSEMLTKMRRTMSRKQDEGNYSSFELKLTAVLLMLVEYFKEDIDALFIMVEETTGFDDVTDELLKSDKASRDGAPILVISGSNAYDFKDIFFVIDNTVLTSVSTWKEAILFMFQAHYVFNLKYSSKIQVLMTFIQRVIAKINPNKGNKCPSTSEEKRAMQKALRLSNVFTKFKEDEQEEAQKENRSSIRSR